MNEIAEPFPISLQAVSKHLKVLEQAGLIARGKDRQLRPSRIQGDGVQRGRGVPRGLPASSGTRASTGSASTCRSDGEIATRDRDQARLRRPARARLARVDPAGRSSRAGGASAAGPRGWTRSSWTSGRAATFRVTTVNDEDGSEMTNEGTYSEVDPPRAARRSARRVVTFTDLGDGRTEMSFHTTTEAERGAPERMRPAA